MICETLRDSQSLRAMHLPPPTAQPTEEPRKVWAVFVVLPSFSVPISKSLSSFLYYNTLERRAVCQ